MRFVVVDTDALSEIWQGSSDHLAAHLVESIPVISFAAVAELHFGAAKHAGVSDGSLRWRRRSAGT